VRRMVLDELAVLHLDSGWGRRTYRIRVVGETQEDFVFKALEDIPMPGRRHLKSGARGRAPKCAVTKE